MLALDLRVGERSDGLPVLSIRGEERAERALLRHVLVDLEMLPDENGDAVVICRVPDRRLVAARSAPLAGDLFFSLEEALGGGRRPSLALETDGGEAESLDERLSWCLLDFSGSRGRAAEAALREDWAEAATHGRAAVDANPDAEGYRVLLGRSLIEAGREDEACAAFEDELARFPRSHRARYELAALAWRHLRRDEALRLLGEALELQPNHLQALLLLADLRLSGGRSDVVELLGRAWRLSGSLSPVHVLELLTRRRREALLPAVRDEARRCRLDGPVIATRASAESAQGEAEAPVSEPSGSSATGAEADVESARVAVVELRRAGPVAEAPSGEDEGPEPLPLDPLTRDELVRIAAREILRDGSVTPEEKVLFSKICARFGAGADLVSRLAAEERKRILAGEVTPRAFDGPTFFREILRRARVDGIVEAEEARIVEVCRHLLGLGEDELRVAEREIDGG